MANLTTQEERVCADVMGRISARRIARARMRAGAYGFFLICSIVALAPAAQYVAVHAVSSGFTEYVSLIASDGSQLSGSWGSLMLSLIDSVPLLGIMAILAALTASAFCAQKFLGTRESLSHSLLHSAI